MTFRTLTFKSTLKFGTYHHYTVNELFKMGKEKYIIWAYYHMSHISFMHDVLEKVLITSEDYIEKPGTDTDKFQVADKRYAKHKFAPIQAEIDKGNWKPYYEAKNKKKAEKRIDAQFANSNYTESKESLQAINHGRKHKT